MRKQRRSKVSERSRGAKQKVVTSACDKLGNEKLIIVESPAKARTVQGIVGSEFKVASTMGHVRDLPESSFGVDVESDFAPRYVIIPSRRKVIRELQKAAKRAREVYIASDPDREGEAIAWHVAQLINHPHTKRVEFHEITKNAVLRALNSPRDIDMNLVNAQQARRVLDRIFGYHLSPLLWSKVARGLSAGRVQSVALMLVCEREREIQNFVPQEYWTITVLFTPEGRDEPFKAKLIKFAGSDVQIPNEQEALRIAEELRQQEFIVTEVKREDKAKSPPPPFITSTLQQEASRKLGFNPEQTMRIAQQLYEGLEVGDEGSVGLITYMRTDSTRISPEAIQQAREFIMTTFGEQYLPEKPRQYRPKRLAQDAHEAIRPTSVMRRPSNVEPYLTRAQFDLYSLIWHRFIASQMADAIYDTMRIDIQGGNYLLRASGSRLKFDGYLAAYQEGKDEDEEQEEEGWLPDVHVGERLRLLDIIPEQHWTKPPPRFTQATLVRALERYGIGRPSTYAPIISTIIKRGYVEVKGKKLYATPLGMLVNDQLVAHFPELINVKFTAQMEERLDDIEEGNADWVGVVRHFYEPFMQALERAQKNMEQLKGIETDKTCPKCGRNMVIRYSRRGPFLACSGFPSCKFTAQLLEGASPGAPCVQVEEKMVVEEQRGIEGGTHICERRCQVCGAPMVKRIGRMGAFWGCSNYPQCNFTMPIDDSKLIPCPADGCDGYLRPRVARKGKFKGKIFYGCSNYPKCTVLLPGKPTGERCPVCNSPLIEVKERSKPIIKCSSGECEFVRDAETLSSIAIQSRHEGDSEG
ncbi:MAG: type I DNA topoisomerase [Armatimonadota bacterium]|nr:type I DNA topoisomerase [Armatimonadota bacterium]MCX7778489.1 type I DNA topoisomerase [Armatimonadota bacterium]MDW8026577.1 type I DNA topoisomerase [Armatimonadota bacterium]